MKRRNFTCGITAAVACAGIATRVLGSESHEGGDDLKLRDLIRLQVPGMGRQRISRLILTANGRSGISVNLGRTFPQRNDDRIVLSGVTRPTLRHEAETGTRIADVHFTRNTLVIPLPRLAMPDGSTLTIGDGKMAYTLGVFSRLKQGETDQVPQLGELPVVGRLFRSARSTRSRPELMILVHASMVRDD